jgi:4-hydroxy-3-methylbut-2-en-1-yl diphosphate reductase
VTTDVGSGRSRVPSRPAPDTGGPTRRVVIATRLLTPDGRRIPCPAFEILAGNARRRGLDVVTRPVEVERAPSDPATDVGGAALAVFAFAPSASRSEGEAVALAVAVDRGDTATAEAARLLAADIAACVQPRTVIMPFPRSFCAGVERAIEMVELAIGRARRAGAGPVYVRRQIVHNTHVVRDLERRGAVFVEELCEVPDGATVVFSAHGVSAAVRAEAARRGLDVVDATCPLVAKVHAEARRFAARGDTVVLIGHRGHDEAVGTLGQAPGRTVLVQTPEDVAALQVPDEDRVSYLTQTTLAVSEVRHLVEMLAERYPRLQGPASQDICYATTNRQQAVTAVAEQAELMLVVGSPTSANSRALVEVARRQGRPAHLIEDAADIDLAWLRGVSTLGVTAGASASPLLTDAVVRAVSGLGETTVRERRVTEERASFSVPGKVRMP